MLISATTHAQLPPVLFMTLALSACSSSSSPAGQPDKTDKRDKTQTSAAAISPNRDLPRLDALDRGVSIHLDRVLARPGAKGILIPKGPEWFSSHGLGVTVWRGDVPTHDVAISSHWHLAFDDTKRQLFGDLLVYGLEQGQLGSVLTKGLARPGAADLTLERAQVAPERDLAVVSLRTALGAPPQPWFLVQPDTGAVIRELAAGAKRGPAPTAAFGSGVVAVGRYPDEDQVVIFERPSGREKATHRLPGYASYLHAHPRGDALAATTPYGDVIIFDAATGAERVRYKPYSKPVFGFAFHPTLPLVALSTDAYIELWSITDQPHSHARWPGRFEALAFDHDGQHLYGGGHDEITVLRLAPDGVSPEYPTPAASPPTPWRPRGPDTSDGWRDTKQLERVMTLAGDSHAGFAFAADHSWLSTDGYRITYWQGYRPVKNLDVRASGGVRLGLDGTIYGDRTAYDLTAGAVKDRYHAPLSLVGPQQVGRGLSIGHLAVAPAADVAILYLDWRPPRRIGRSPDRYAYPNKKPDVANRWHLVDLKTGATLHVGEEIPLILGATSVAFTDDRIAVTNANDRITVLSRENGAWTLETTLSLRGVAWVGFSRLSDGTPILVAITRDGNATVWTVAGWRQAPVALSGQPSGRADATAIHPGAPLVAIGGRDGAVAVYRLTASSAERLAAPTFDTAVTELEFAPRERLFVGLRHGKPYRSSIVVLREKGDGEKGDGANF